MVTHSLVGALGCGVYGCPPKLVASEMKNLLLEPEFRGYFEQVVFAVYDKTDNQKKIGAFQDAFAEVKI